MKHKFFSKRGLALVVSVMMCLSAMSTTAWAGNFKDLQDLIDKTEADADGFKNVTLEEDYTYGGASTRNQGNDDNGSKTINIGSKDENKNVNLNLNLNGHKIDGNGQSDSVITVKNGGNLTLKDETPENPEVANPDTDAVGTITGGKGSSSNKGTEGGGVIVRDGGKFTMEGGAISDNTVEYRGGGVHVEGAGEFTMKGGTIKDNTTTNESESYGGGVSVWGGGKFTMKDGIITGNESITGGGVYMYQRSAGNHEGSTFTMDGGEITGNTTSDATKDIQIDGDANSMDKITINHGTISAADAEKYAGSNSDYNVTDSEGDKVTVHKAPNSNEWVKDETSHWHVCGADGCNQLFGNVEAHDFVEETITPATCKVAGVKKLTCRVCGYETTGTISMIEHTPVPDEAAAPTCTEDGKTAGSHCDVCGDIIVEQEVDPATGHAWGTWTESGDGHQRVCANDSSHIETAGHSMTGWGATEADGYQHNRCTVCGYEDTRLAPVDPGTGDGDTDTEDPGTVVIPDPDVPLGDEPAPAVTITDEDVPLAGLVTLAQLLDELHRHEGAPEVHIPDGFPFADHEYAEAICWGLDNALVFHTEEEPLDPDEIVTVGLMREVLTNFVAYRGVEEFTVELAGADDEIVMDLGERLVVFYAQLAEAEAAAEADETEAA